MAPLSKAENPGALRKLLSTHPQFEFLIKIEREEIRGD